MTKTPIKLSLCVLLTVAAANSLLNPHAARAQGRSNLAELVQDARGEVDPTWREFYRFVARQVRRLPRNTRLLYLSGPISNGGRGSIPANLEYMLDVSQRLSLDNTVVLSPALLEQSRQGTSRALPGWEDPSPALRAKIRGWSEATFMRMWNEIFASDNPVSRRMNGLVRLPDWHTSIGATTESMWAKGEGLPIWDVRENNGSLELDEVTYDPMASALEATELNPAVTRAEILRQTRAAREQGARAMVVRPGFMQAVASELRGTEVVPKSVIGFPTERFESLNEFPRVETSTKIRDLRRAIDGAQAGGAQSIEVDMILDVHSLHAAGEAFRRGDRNEASRLLQAVQHDINEVVAEASRYGDERGVRTKVMTIIETSLLTAAEIRAAGAILRGARVLAAKTSTGYGTRGASERDVRILYGALGRMVLIKASGGVGPSNIVRLRRAGAHVFGTSSPSAFGRVRFPARSVSEANRPVPRRPRTQGRARPVRAGRY